jgi:hypothetical protein
VALNAALWWALGIGAAVVGGVLLVHLAWRLHGLWRIYRAGPRRLWATRHRLWREPTSADSADLRFGPGGADHVPAPPFQFREEHFTGSQPCLSVRDARSRVWRVKWGDEAKSEAFAVRMASALGYFAEVTHYIAEGRIEDVGPLSRARSCVDDAGHFREARFELEDSSVRMLFNEHSWAWNDNPFVGTPQLAGLKILVMLLSNWDTKDRRDVSRGSNTAIFELRLSRWAREARYLITDWGGSMGKWGSNIVSRGRWDAAGFEAQTPSFITGVQDGVVHFGYQGQRTAEIARGITVEDARWFFGYAGRIGESAIGQGLLAAGADPDEARRFAHALADRIRLLGQAVGAEAPPGRTVRA